MRILIFGAARRVKIVIFREEHFFTPRRVFLLQLFSQILRKRFMKPELAALAIFGVRLALNTPFVHSR
jgi:hypothetical protein